MNTDEQPKETADQPKRDLNEVLFVNLGLSEILASRIMRGHILDEIISVLLQKGILTKEGLSRALAEGEKYIQESSHDLHTARPDSPDRDKLVTNMRAAAETITTRMRDKFIDPRDSGSPNV